ncbi:TetR/AcrR family transcriptional regulator [Vibrio sonorensis]|uniref:TetR/AcrR family transcriptional regulator n=1 Tax=Vibrio sonorensis TaxID=1004316 RepID=UPI0008D97876|nr:TetR/AcrR family transcriptional regulator [Vibrio sonorensis]
MNQRKQGRRSAQDALKTKALIMQVAADMFCELGFERVSLRNISDKAGVSHSLIRHHFGSKEQIWYAISDGLDAYIGTYMLEVIKHIPSTCKPNVALYTFVVRMLAMLLEFKQPIQLMADAMRQEQKLFDYLIDNSGEIESLVEAMADQYNNAHPEKPINVWEIKWQLIMYSHGAASMEPFMKETWSEETDSVQQCLINHWEMFNRQMALTFQIEESEVIHAEKVADLVYHVPCEWGDLKFDNCE